MRRTTRRAAVLALLALLVSIGISSAQAGRVNFEKETHFRCYIVSQQTPEPAETVTLSDQFLDATLTVDEPLQFCAPTSKNGLPIQEPEEHLTMYGAPHELSPHLRVFTEERVGTTVTLDDQFGSDTVRVEQPDLFCNPVEKIHNGVRERIQERAVHLTCYDIKGPQRTEATQFGVRNQFETDTFTITSFELLCVPSEKTGFVPVS